MIQCPHCGASRVHTSTSPICEICGRSVFDGDTNSLSPSLPAGIPWEHTEHMNIFKALVATIRECLIKPFQFFKKITESSSLFHALLFGLVTGSIGVLFDVMWQKSFANTWEFLSIQGIDPDFRSTGTNTLLFSPLILLMHIFFLSLYVHGLLVITRAKHTTFRSTVITVSYIQSASVLSIIPSLGNAISPVWALIILIIGISSVHKISKTRTFITIILPFIFIGLFTTFILICALSSSYLVSIFFKEILPFFR